MYFGNLRLTNAGNALIVKALNGETLTFTKLGLGSGSTPADPSQLTDLVNPQIKFALTSISTGDGCAELIGTFSSSDLSDSFTVREIGVYADDPDDGEILYAYANAGNHPSYLPKGTGNAYERLTMSVVVAVGSAENVTAVISEYIGYVTKEAFDAHVADTENPHEVTAAQVGLGNVPNVSTNNQTPTFIEADTLSNIASGETMNVLFGKIKKALSALIDHITAKNGTFTLASGLTAQYTRANIRQIGHVVYVELYVTFNTSHDVSSLALGTITGVDVPSVTRYFPCVVGGNIGLAACASSNNAMQLIVESEGSPHINSAQLEFSYYVD